MIEAIAPVAVADGEAGIDAHAGRRVSVTEVADTFIALMRSFTRTKARYMALAEHDMEWSSQVLLRHLAHVGPVRASAIAECLQFDPSTVSRQVAAMVKDGLVERVADPEDGRASTLVLTPKADAVLVAHDDVRIRHFADMLADWDEPDLRRFAALLRRFTDDYEKSSTRFISERAQARHHSAEGKH